MSDRYVCFDGMTWPKPDGDLEWRLRWAPNTVTPQDLMWAASVIGAYRQLIYDPQRVSRSKLSRIRRALGSPSVSSSGGDR